MSVTFKNAGTQQLEVDINWIYPPNLQSHFVQNAVAQHQAGFFILSFFEVWPPVVINKTDEETQEALKELTSIDATCVARLVLTPAKMQELSDVIAENLRKYNDRVLALQSCIDDPTEE